MGYGLRQKIGAILLDWPRYEIGLLADWVRIRNRSETLRSSPTGRGVVCDWTWTSDLHIAKVFPMLGSRLMNRALADWPVRFADGPMNPRNDVRVSFVIGHRGVARFPHLLATLASIAGQRGVDCECIVVEQSIEPEIRDRLPAWVRYIHTPVPTPEMPYSRSWTLNVGARLANGSLLVFHDNDMLVPELYAAELWARHEEEYEVVNLKRFVFYLDEQSSRRILSTRTAAIDVPVDTATQNLQAGGSLAIARDAFFSIGGLDESFVGWGGEDNEFWDRAQTLRVWPYAYLPLIHLWHPAQPGKGQATNATMSLYLSRSAIPVHERIRELASRQFGQQDRLSGSSPDQGASRSAG